jgi:hypothetical protein
MKMRYVFIDTSVFIQTGFFKEGGVTSNFFKLADKGQIKILLPEISKSEWKKHFIEGTTIKNDILKMIRCAGSVDKDISTKLNASAQMINSYNNSLPQLFENKVKMKGVEIVGYDYCEHTAKVVFEKYFTQQKPFGKQGKKKEFPDAFILASLEQYAIINDIPQIIVLSNDSDICKYKSNLLVPRKAEDVLDEINLEIAAENNRISIDVSKFKQYMANNGSQVLVDKIAFLIVNYLKKPELYSCFSDIEEVHEPQVDINIDGKNLKIQQIDENYITAECSVYIQGYVIVNHFDEDESIWDSEDKKYIYEKYRDTKIEINSDIRLNLSYVRNELEMGQPHEIKLKSIDFSDLEENMADDF